MNLRRASQRICMPVAGLLVLAALPGCQKAQSKTVKPPPAVVIVTQPEWETLTESEDFTGRIDAVRTVEVRARVTGYLERLYFEDGSEVKEGSMLFEIDPRPYKAELDRAEGMLAQSDAHLKRLQADFGRATKLFSRGAIGQEEFDRVVGDMGEAKAAVDVARANRDLAKLNLDFTRVTASISGRISRRMVDPGNMVMANETPLTTIVSLDPMYVYFDVDERTLLRLRRLVREGAIKSRSEAEVPVLAALADEENFDHSGTIDFSDNKVDPNTGTLKLRGVLKNPAPRVLSPGMFVRVRLPIGNPHRSLIIPEQAIGTDQGRKFLYVVSEKGEVLYRPVKVGVLENGMREIREGLKSGEKVIISGLQRVRPGAKVTAKFAEEVDSDPDAPERDKPQSGPIAKRDEAADDAARSAGAKSDSGEADAAKSDAEKTDAPKSGAADAQAEKPDAGESDAANPDAAKAGATDADTVKSDTLKSSAVPSRRAPARVQEAVARKTVQKAVAGKVTGAGAAVAATAVPGRVSGPGVTRTGGRGSGSGR